MCVIKLFRELIDESIGVNIIIFSIFKIMMSRVGHGELMWKNTR